MWILLHFEDVDYKDILNKERITYYNKLTEIFKGLENPNTDLVRCLNRPNFYYKDHLKSEENFRTIVRPEMLPNTAQAIARAKLLEAHFNQPNLQNHEKAPCTLVYKLVEELVRLGGKNI